MSTFVVRPKKSPSEKYVFIKESHLGRDILQNTRKAEVECTFTAENREDEQNCASDLEQNSESTSSTDKVKNEVHIDEEEINIIFDCKTEDDESILTEQMNSELTKERISIEQYEDIKLKEEIMEAEESHKEDKSSYTIDDETENKITDKGEEIKIICEYITEDKTDAAEQSGSKSDHQENSNFGNHKNIISDENRVTPEDEDEYRENHLEKNIDMIVSSKDISRPFMCDTCGFRFKRRDHLFRHLLTHAPDRDKRLRPFLCDLCGYRAIRKSQLDQHSLQHADDPKRFQCESCPFRTAYSMVLKSHRLIHKNKKDLKMYKCTACSYETFRKYSLQKHVQNVHELSETGPMLKCSQCDYETRVKAHMDYHSIIHKSKREATIHKCKECTFESRHLGSLVRHQLIHKPNSAKQEKILKCKLCEYNTLRMENFKRHLNTIHDIVEMSKANILKYRDLRFEDNNSGNSDFRQRNTNREPEEDEVVSGIDTEDERNELVGIESDTSDFEDRPDLVETTLGYAEESSQSGFTDNIEIEITECERIPESDEEANHEPIKADFTNSDDFVNEVDPQSKEVGFEKDENFEFSRISSFNMLECELCDFKTIYRSSLKRHNLIHFPKDGTTYKCDNCVFETRKKYLLNQHLLSHTSPSSPIFKCDHCDYQTQVKVRLDYHSVRHVNDAEVWMHKCEECSFQSRHKGSLERHQWTHKPANLKVKKVVSCEFCTYTTLRGHNLKRHLQCVHKIKDVAI